MIVKNNITFANLTFLMLNNVPKLPLNIQHANIQARVYVRAKAKRIRAFKCEAYAKKERKNLLPK